jgi:hypothetical protein
MRAGSMTAIGIAFNPDGIGDLPADPALRIPSTPAETRFTFRMPLA